MCDKCFLKDLSEHKVKWTGEALKKADRLAKEGYIEYETLMHSGFWKITDKGLNYLNV